MERKTHTLRSTLNICFIHTHTHTHTHTHKLILNNQSFIIFFFFHWHKFTIKFTHNSFQTKKKEKNMSWKAKLLQHKMTFFKHINFTAHVPVCQCVICVCVCVCVYIYIYIYIYLNVLCSILC